MYLLSLLKNCYTKHLQNLYEPLQGLKENFEPSLSMLKLTKQEIPTFFWQKNWS